MNNGKKLHQRVSIFFCDKVNHEAINGNKWQDIVFERFLLPIVQKIFIILREPHFGKGGWGGI
jgi:hypothetical protein